MLSLSPPPMEKALSPCRPKPPIVYSKPRISKAQTLDGRLLQLSSQGNLQEAIFLLQRAPNSRLPLRPQTYVALLQSCADLGSPHLARTLHSSLPLLPAASSSFIHTKLVSMYAKCRSLDDARKVFDAMPTRNLITWSAMIGGYVRDQSWHHALRLFCLMMRQGVTPDSFLLPRIVQACAAIADCKTGMLLHSIAVKKGFLHPAAANIYVANSILAMYFKCARLEDAQTFFCKLANKDLVSWNSMISGLYYHGKRDEATRLFNLMLSQPHFKPDIFTWNIYLTNATHFENLDAKLATDLIAQMEGQGVSPNVFTWTCLLSGFVQNDKCADALQLFTQMLNSKVEPNSMTIASVVSACATLKWLTTGKLLHSYAVKKGIDKSVLLANSLIDMYAKCIVLEEAQKVFDKLPDRDIVSWNSIIGGYAHAAFYNKAFELFSLMDKLGIQQNAVTWNALISGFFRNGEVAEALHLLCRMKASGVARNLVSWNIIIAGMAQNGYTDKALNVFRQMQTVPVRPDSATFLSMVPALEYLVCSSKVREAHCFIIRTGIEHGCTPVTNVLIWTYAKSGDLNSALTLFNSLSSKTLISWNCILGSCALHGRATTLLELFSKMRLEGVAPDRTTLSSVINAYGLGGLVKEGEELFSSLSELYGVKRTTDHYADMIKLYGQAGRLKDAQDLFDQMPLEPDEKVWNALLKAAGMHSDLELTIHVAENLLRIEPWDPQILKVLSNLYELAGSSKKPPVPETDSGLHGCCYLDFRHKVRCFLTGELPSESKISKLIEGAINSGLEIPQVCSLLDYEEDREEDGVLHSEKKAIAFQIIYSSPCSSSSSSSTRKAIRIIKNGRVCAHCHTFAKLMGKLHTREIFIKDSSCLHRFKDGECSCRDYW